MFLAIASIFYAYDGFYVSAGIQSEMKEPKKTPMALFLGLSLTTLIYLIIAISMSINGGSFSKMHAYSINLMGLKATNIIFGIMNIFIAIGVLGIANGFAMWMPRYIEDLLIKGDLPFWEKLAPKVNPRKPVVGIIYSSIISVPLIIIFTLIGCIRIHWYFKLWDCLWQYNVYGQVIFICWLNGKLKCLRMLLISCFSYLWWNKK
nr:amino acid permease [Mycoplasmopsis bovis]